MKNFSAEDRYGRTKTISKVVISTALGVNGSGIFYYKMSPRYRELLRVVREKKVTVFTKSVTRFPRQGNFVWWKPWTYKYIQSFGRPGELGMLNAYDLTNIGVEAAAPQMARALEKGFQVVPNFYPEFKKGPATSSRETCEAIEILKRALGENFWIIELNLSCLNSEEKIGENMDDAVRCVRVIKENFPWLKVIAKTSVVHPFSLYHRLEEAGVDVIHGVNTIPFELLYPKRISPLAAVGGGEVSGEPAYFEAKQYQEQLRMVTSLPIIMGCGITRVGDLESYWNRGANALSICTVALRDPETAIRIINH